MHLVEPQIATVKRDWQPMRIAWAWKRSCFIEKARAEKEAKKLNINVMLNAEAKNI